MARRRTKPTWKALLLLLLLLGIYLYEEGYLDRLLEPLEQLPQVGAPDDRTAERPGDAPELPAAKTASGSWYQLYFTRPTYPERPQNRQGGVDAALVADIEAAQRSVDLAVFELELEPVVHALLQAHQRGVRVRVVTDDQNLEDPEAAELAGRLQEAGVQLGFDQRSPFMHIKMMIVDDTIVWTGSMNLTANGVYRNDNNMLRFAIPQLTEDYKRRFEWLIVGREEGDEPPPVRNAGVSLDGGVRIHNFFSPRGGGAAAIEERLRGARRSIRLLAFSFTADEQKQILIAKQREGLLIQGVVESRNASGSGADFEELLQAGIDVHKDGNSYIMHNKVYIIDEQTVITGSYNFSASAERSNDENLLIIDDPSLAQLYLQEFMRIYEQARNPTRCGS